MKKWQSSGVSGKLEAKVGFYLPHPEKWVKLRKIKNFSSGGFLWMFSLGFGVLAIFLFQNLCLTSKSPMIGQFHVIFQNLENQLYQPPTVQENFFDMPFLMSHGGVFHKGSKLANLKKVYHKVCVLQRLCLLRLIFELVVFFSVHTLHYDILILRHTSAQESKK